MQRPDPEKRRQILAVAARLFATRPFHEVKLDDVAAGARIGKGTVYVYFAGKEQLYAALLDEGFTTMIADLRQRLGPTGGRATDDLGAVVRALLAHARRFPHLFHLMRAGRQLPCSALIARHRQELMQLVGEIVRRGVRQRELRDAHPDLTAAYVPSLVRAAVLYGPAEPDDDAIAEHMVAVLTRGLAASRRAPPRRKAARPGARNTAARNTAARNTGARNTATKAAAARSAAARRSRR